MVMACHIPLWGLSGATTTTFPKSFTASTKLRMPGAVMPSSLVIRITGFFLTLAFAIVASLAVKMTIIRQFAKPQGVWVKNILHKLKYLVYSPNKISKPWPMPIKTSSTCAA